VDHPAFIDMIEQKMMLEWLSDVANITALWRLGSG
jgi:hypothetical protein